MTASVLGLIRDDHDRIGMLLDRLHREGPDGGAPPTLGALLDLLVRHETAEAALVRPRTRETRGGGDVADRLDDQERRLLHLVTSLRRTSADGPVPPDPLEQLRHSVLQHLDTEEDLEHPRLVDHLAPSTLADLGRRYRRVLERDITALEEATAAGRARAGDGGEGRPAR